MTSPFHPSATTDPRSKSRAKDITPVSVGAVHEDDEEYKTSLSNLTERIETLVNHTGQLYTEFQDHPIKYNVQVRDLDDDNYELVEPILVVIEEYPGSESLIASFPEVEAFGEGVTEAEALLNLKHAILDLYDELVQTPSEGLGDLPKTWQRVLRRVIREVEDK